MVVKPATRTEELIVRVLREHDDKALMREELDERVDRARNTIRRGIQKLVRDGRAERVPLPDQCFLIRLLE